MNETDENINVKFFISVLTRCAEAEQLVRKTDGTTAEETLTKSVSAVGPVIGQRITENPISSEVLL